MRILYRDSLVEKEELAAIKEVFEENAVDVLTHPSLRDQIVVGRYSVLPFYVEIEKSLKEINSKLINSYEQHKYIADLRNWYEDFKDITPKTYFSVSELPNDENSKWFLKGETNSKKFQWNTHCFAVGKRNAIETMCRLQQDGLISTQEIYAREFVPLQTYMEGFYGLPITKEFRVFIGYGKILGAGYYWASHVEDLKEEGIEIPKISEIPYDFLADICNRVKNKAPFVVVDVAQTQSGHWIVVELNDGQMSGLSMVPAKEMYENLFSVVKKQESTNGMLKKRSFLCKNR